MRLPPTPCRVCFRPCVFKNLSLLAKKVGGSESCFGRSARPRGMVRGMGARGAHERALMGDDALAPIFPDIHPAERYRFLAARDGSLEEAIEMLRSHLLWRSAHELAMANTEDPPPLIGSTLCAIRLKLPNPPSHATTRYACTSSVEQARICVGGRHGQGRQPLRVPQVLPHRPDAWLLRAVRARLLRLPRWDARPQLRRATNRVGR